MKELNKLYLESKHAEYEEYCNNQECEKCKLYDLDFPIECKFAFAVLRGIGKIKMKFNDSEV